jgi:prophage antirepressor-like protein
MQNEIRIFESKEFGKVRTIQIAGQPWFVLKDVCNVLGLGSPHKVAERLDEDEKGRSSIPTLGGAQEMGVINESGIYAVILRSDKPNARAFRKWITSDVLPTIRKHGAYVTDDLLDQLIENPEVAQALFEKLKSERMKKGVLEEYVAELTPKADYHDIVLKYPGAFLVSVIAKDYGMTAADFNKMLHDYGIQFQFKTNKTWLLYQPYEGKGYTITNTYRYANGNVVRVLTCWTQKGRAFLYDFLKMHGILPKTERAEHEQLQLTDTPPVV